MHSRQSSRTPIVVALIVASLGALAAQGITLPNQPDSVKFAIIGDSGTGSDVAVPRRQTAHRLANGFPVSVRADDGRQPVRRQQGAGLPEEI